MIWPQVSECPEAPEGERGKEGSFPRAFRGSVSLPTPWFQMSSPPNCERINFCSCKPLNLWLICYDSHRKLIHLRRAGSLLSSAHGGHTFEITEFSAGRNSRAELPGISQIQAARPHLMAVSTSTYHSTLFHLVFIFKLTYLSCSKVPGRTLWVGRTSTTCDSLAPPLYSYQNIYETPSLYWTLFMSLEMQ